MTDPTLAEAEYATIKRQTRQEKVFERLEAEVPLAKLEQKLLKKYHTHLALFDDPYITT